MGLYEQVVADAKGIACVLTYNKDARSRPITGSECLSHILTALV